MMFDRSDLIVALFIAALTAIPLMTATRDVDVGVESTSTAVAGGDTLPIVLVSNEYETAVVTVVNGRVIDVNNRCGPRRTGATTGR